MTEKKRPYMSYLLRLWQIKEKGKLVWRASLESPGSGERVGFGSLPELYHFLQQQIRIFPNEKEQVAGFEMPSKPDRTNYEGKERDQS
jgi:hypothetical protein